MFPLGDTDKPAVRREAEARGLLVADKPDSHDICFVADGDNAGWLREKLGDRAPNHGGDIVDATTGETVGSHTGTYGFTIGQRRGLRLGTPGAGRQAPLRPRHRARQRHGHGRPARAAGGRPDRRHPAALVRHRARAGRRHRAAARPRRRAPRDGASSPSDRVSIDLLDPAEGIAPGQAAVIYDGTRVVGSATIESTRPVGAA